MSARILVVEDDERLARLLVELLEREGHEVGWVARGDVAEDRAVLEQPDLLLLDIGLPGRDGFEVCRALRPRYQGRILILTARGEEIDEVVGLELGADDYLAKPVAPRRLIARVRALLRRPAPPAASVHNGPLCIDPERRCVSVNGEAVPLTTAEFDLLWLLARRLGQVVTRDEVYQALRGSPYDGVDRSMDLRVSRLRRQLGDDPVSPQYILTIRGVGYMLARAG